MSLAVTMLFSYIPPLLYKDMATVVNNTGNGYNKRPVWQWVAIYLVLAAVVYGLYYYLVVKKNNGYSVIAPSQSPPVITTLPTLSPGAASPSAATPSPGVTTQTLGPTAAPMQIAMNGTEFAFSPSTLNAKVGQTVKITLTNNGKFPHNLSFPDLNVATKTISPGEKDTIAFTPDKAGTYTYLCTVPGHADRGMTGTLTVTAP